MRHVLLSILLVVLTVRHSVQAEDDVLNFARQWAGREEKAQATPVPEPVQAPRESVKKKPAPAKTTRASASTRAVAPSSAQSPAQKEAPVSDITQLPVPAPAAAPLADAALLGQWLKTFLQTLSPTPQETLLQEMNAVQRREIAELRAQLKAREEDERRLQAMLRELQPPPVPSAREGQEDFAAGVAAGRELQTMLETRKKWGVNMDPRLFIAGLTDALRNENRLDEERIGLALAGLDQRLAGAREQFFRQRETRDRQWLKAFQRDNTRQVTAEGYHYRIQHQGETPLANDSILTVALMRKFTDGTILEDSDLSGQYIHAPLREFPPLVQQPLHAIGNHGEGEMAVTVNRHGEPDPEGKLLEIWQFRVMDAVGVSQAVESVQNSMSR